MLQYISSSFALLFFSLMLCTSGRAQNDLPCNDADRWQQAVKYTMVIDMDVKTNRYAGTQKLEYTNNSPDTLRRVFYHLYFNAFQPGSMMDVRNLTLPDADRRVGDRISKLGPDEIGYIKVISTTSHH